MATCTTWEKMRCTKFGKSRCQIPWHSAENDARGHLPSSPCHHGCERRQRPLSTTARLQLVFFLSGCPTCLTHSFNNINISQCIHIWTRPPCQPLPYLNLVSLLYTSGLSDGTIGLTPMHFVLYVTLWARTVPSCSCCASRGFNHWF